MTKGEQPPAMSNLTVGINRTHLQQQHDTSETVNQFLRCFCIHRGAIAFKK